MLPRLIMHRSLFSFALTLTLAFGFAASALADGGAANRCVAVIGTNDLHGVIEPQELHAGGKTLRYGGVLALSGYLERLRQKYGERIVLLDGGDLYQGTIASNLSWGKAIIQAYNTLGYTGSAIGNHEFDFGGGDISDDLLAVIKQRIAEAKFPFLAVNIFEKATHQRIAWPNVQPSMIVDAGGIKVGILGVSTVETPRVTRPQNVATLEFLEPAPFVIAEARKLRSQGAQLVVLVGHLGGSCSKLVDPHDLSSCEPGAELFELIAKLPEGTLDVAVGGHTHAYVAQWVNGVATIEAGARGRSFGWVEACLANEGGIAKAQSKIMTPPTLCLDEWQDGGCRKRKDPVPVRPATFLEGPVVPTTAITQVMKPYIDEVKTTYGKALGVHLAKPLSRDASPGLGEVVCHAVANAAQAGICVQNKGGVRADLPAGELTYGQVFEVLPFDNKVAVLQLTAKELQEFVELLFKRRDGNVPFIHGLTVQVQKEGLVLLQADGSPLKEGARYKVATSDFLAQGGEGLDEVFKAVAPSDLTILSVDMREALIAYLKSHHPAKR